MKPHHGAALVLVGWYLMVPPIPPTVLQNGNKDHDWGLTAPLNEWKTAAVFDSASACQRAQIQYQGIAGRNQSLDPLMLKKFVEAVQCIASDDPRLAK